MKIKKSKLARIIKEEMQRVVSEQQRYPREPTSHRSEMSLSDTKRGAPRAARRAERQFGKRLADYELSMAQMGEEVSLDDYLKQNLLWVWDYPESEYSWPESSFDEKKQIMYDLGDQAYAVENNKLHNLGLDQEIMLLSRAGDLMRLSRDFKQGYEDAEHDESWDRMLQRDLDY